MRRTGWIPRALALARVDLGRASRQPSVVALLVATFGSVAASIGADAALVRVGTALFPSTAGYAHFRFADYAALTVLGVVAAGATWPLATRITSTPRQLLFRLAITVTVVLLLPDVWLLVTGQPAEAVAVLVAMHLAIALITYNLLVHVASVGSDGAPPAPQTGGPAVVAAVRGPSGPRSAAPRGIWLAMTGVVAVESVLGLAALVAVPLTRPNAVVPAGGRGVYLAHAVVGLLLGVGAAILLITQLGAVRVGFWSSLVGLVGTAVGAGGGALAVEQSTRLAGMGLMLVGPLVAGFAYLTPIGFADDGTGPVPSGRRAPSFERGPSWRASLDSASLDSALLDSAPLDPAQPGASLAGPAWDDRHGGELVCPRHPTAGDTRRSSAADATGEEWAATCLAAGTCPLCPGQSLRALRTASICGCCETVYRHLDGDDTAWVATPGEQVARR